ncbi:MAG: diguanylate cyclase, partial [Gammaproteobacteria bacterium]|nr:diguanylate cyclase [Gammaproteobacteria bacterium]
MKSLGIRLAIVISIVLAGLIAVAGLFLERSLSRSIQDEGVEQAQLHAQTILGSLVTLMLNGNGTLAREWLDRLHGVAGIEDIGVLRTDGTPAFTDLSTVHAVNAFLGDPRFHREQITQFESSRPLPSNMFRQALSGQTAYELTRDGVITIAMPIQAQMECLTCHGYESNVLRGVLSLSLDNSAMLQRIRDMRHAIIMGAIAMVMILGLALWLALKFHVLRPIESLRAALVRMTQGSTEQPLAVDRQDELGQLAGVFNRMQSEVRDSQQRTRAVMDNVVDGVLTLRQDGTIEMINPATKRLFGYGDDELLGQHVDVLIPEKFRRSAAGIIAELGVPPVLGTPYEVTGLRSNDSTFPMEVTVSEMEVGGSLYYIVTVRDITTRKARTAALRYQALHDALTDLPNRTLLMDRLQQGLRKANRTDGTMALLLMDLDRFKEVNDTLGHHVGDKLLQQVAYRLRHVLRESDTVARLGGDEFSVILPDADARQAVVTAQKIIKAVEKTINVEGNDLHVGASVGVAMFPQHGDTANV